MSAVPKLRYTLEEYLELEKTSQERYEFFDGEVFCMSGVSEKHDAIEVNLIVSLDRKLEGRNCRVFASNMRLKVPTMPPYRYGDVSALCGKPKFEKIDGLDILVNPSLIIEVLSSSTESYDRGAKFTQYKSIESFREYVLVSQLQMHVTHFVKVEENGWLQNDFTKADDKVFLQSVDCEITLSEIYLNIDFDENPLEYLRLVR